MGVGDWEQKSKVVWIYPREQGMLRDISIINKNFGKKGRKNYEICKENQGRKSKSLKYEIKTWLYMGQKQLNMGNPLGGLPVHASEKNVCHFYSAFLNKGCKSFIDTLACFIYQNACWSQNLMLIKVEKS